MDLFVAIVAGTLIVVFLVVAIVRHLRAEKAREFNAHVDFDLNMIAADKRSAGLDANVAARWQG